MSASSPSSATLDLFNRSSYAHGDPGYRQTDTSFDAAQEIRPKQGKLQQLVLDLLADHGPLATFEIAALANLPEKSVQPRTTELRNAGKIEDSGERRKATGSKTGSIVWRKKCA